MATEIRVRRDIQPVSTRCAAEGWSHYILVPGAAWPHGANHPLLKEQEWAFETVETATANPGEKRSVRRRKPDDETE